MEPERVLELLDQLHRHIQGVLKCKVELDKILTKEILDHHRPLIKKH